MWVSIDFCLIPIGKSTSISPYIAACQVIIEKFGLTYELYPNGTAIEGEWKNVFECIESCHKEVHKLGVNRIFTNVRINTSSLSRKSFQGKVKKVRSLLI